MSRDMFEIVSCAVISPSRILRFCDRWIYHKIKQTAQFLKELVIAADLDVSRDVIATRIQSKKGCFSVWKMEWTALCSLHARFTRATLENRTERGMNLRYSFGLKTVYLFGCSRSRHTVTALGDTVKKVVEFTAESIISLSDPERSNQIQRRILLKLQTSEQTPLMWKPWEKLFNNHKFPPFTIDLT